MRDEDYRQLSETIQEFCDQRDWDQFHGAKDLAIGVTTEAAELLEIFRFKTAAEIEDFMRGGDTPERKNVKDELADVLFFLIRFAQRYHIDIFQALRDKMVRNAEKYPVDRAKGSNQKYTAWRDY